MKKCIDDIRIQGIYDFGYGVVAKMVMCDNTISAGSKALYAYICTFANAEKKAWPGREKICFDLSINKDSFTKYLNELKVKKYIITKRRKNEKGQFLGNAYIIVTQLESSQQKEPCLENPCPEKSDMAQMPTSSQLTPCPEKTDMGNPCPKEPCLENPCPEKSDTAQMPVSSQFTPCPKKPCPEISDTNSTSTNSTITRSNNTKQQQQMVPSTSTVASAVQVKQKYVVVVEDGKKENDENMKAIAALEALEVDPSLIARFIQSCSTARILQVCKAANIRAETNPGGWVRKALEENWNIAIRKEKQPVPPDHLYEKTLKMNQEMEKAKKEAVTLHEARAGLKALGNIIKKGKG